MTDTVEIEKNTETQAQEKFEKKMGNEALWQQVFGIGAPELKKMQKWNKKLPSDPRCKLCNAPFKGIGGWLMRFKGKARNNRNPNFCNACDSFIEAHPGGAEIDLSMLFVDIRGSTDYAEHANPLDVSQRINAFLDAATNIIIDNDGFVAAFYGDCIVATWPPGFCGEEHAKKCLNTAIEVARHSIKDHEGKVIPVGVGAHTGSMYISVVSAAKGSFRDVSVFGANVNLTARLASSAQASEALVSEDIINAAKQTFAADKKKELTLKGFSQSVTAYSA
ncbi:MAG: adenylate/guanylate cyclase domain-containing protein [Cellvibrionaceae bacterium]